MLIKVCSLGGRVFPRASALFEEALPIFPPKKAKRRIGHAVFADFSLFLVMVKLSASDIIHNTLKAFRHFRYPNNADFRIDDFQECRRKHIIRVKFSGMRQSDVCNFHFVRVPPCEFAVLSAPDKE